MVRRVSAIPRLEARPREGHKGQFGRVLVIGGSRGMVGAPALAANAALRSGAGLATVACPVSVQTAVATLCPCATSVPLPEGRGGVIEPKRAFESLKREGFLDPAKRPTVIAAGPGLGSGGAGFDREWVRLLNRLSEALDAPLVLDADGLNALGELGAGAGGRRGGAKLSKAVLTPHPGELARLRGTSTEEVQRARERVAIETARLTSSAGAGQAERGVVVLKGASTVVTDGERLYVNSTGNPGMATGGSGDVLTGVIAALVGQGLPRFEAAMLGVNVHGRAGDLAAKVVGETSMIATDLLTYLPRAFLELG